jgi:hypothetical protein
VASPAPDPGRAERLAILDEEIGRLPERQRAAIVLCDLEGLPHEEAARRLGCPVGTVESRLSRGRQRLHDRLVRRGLAPAAAALWAEMAREASAAMPAALIKHSVRFVTSAPAAGVVPAAVAALAEGVIQMMWLARLKPLAAVAATLVLATAGVAVQGRQQPAPKGAQEQTKTAPPALPSPPALPAPPPPVDSDFAAPPDVAANRALARQQLTLIDNALALAHDLYQNARIEITSGSFSLWGRRRLEALRKAGAGKAEIVTALEKYINYIKDLEAIAKARVEASRATPLDVYETRFLRMEAEIWLSEEKAR